MVDLEGEKSIFKSQTVHGAVVSILATIGSLFAVVKGNVPPEVLWPAITGAAASVWGNVMSIFGRKKATETIK